MSKRIINKATEEETISKVRGMIDYMHPKIEVKARETFVHENEYAIKVIKRKVDFHLAFYAWFLLKYELPNGATAMEMADSFPLNFFTKNEKKIIKNFLHYKDSLFEIEKISKDKKDYTIKDLLDNKFYLIKTLDMPNKFSKKQLIKTMIIQNIEGNYFFYGSVQSFNIEYKEEFIKEMINIIRLENIIKEKRKEGFIEWKFDKEQTSKKEES